MQKRNQFRWRLASGFTIFLITLLISASLPASSEVVTRIDLKIDECSAKFATTNCRGGAFPNGDICVAQGPNNKPFLQFNLSGAGANDSEFVQMDVRLNSDGSCPSDVTDDFPGFPGCTHIPDTPGNSLRVQNNNEHARTWFYKITLQLEGCPDPVEIHPLIENGGSSNPGVGGAP